MVCEFSGQGDYEDPSSNTDAHTYSGLTNNAASTDTVASSGKLYVIMLMYQCNVKAVLFALICPLACLGNFHFSEDKEIYYNDKSSS